MTDPVEFIDRADAERERLQRELRLVNSLVDEYAETLERLKDENHRLTMQVEQLLERM